MAVKEKQLPSISLSNQKRLRASERGQNDLSLLHEPRCQSDLTLTQSVIGP
jgi:hypothetical protein